MASILWEALKKYEDIKEPEPEEEIKAKLEIFKEELENETE